MLERLGVDVLIAEDGGKGVDAVRSGEAVDAVLMDLQMPVLDGFAATRLIREWEEWEQRKDGRASAAGVARLPIIALTADAFAEDRERCLETGMDDFLSKPLDLGKLSATLAQWLPQVSDAAASDVVAPPPVPSAEASAEARIFDEAQMLARLGGDRELARMIIDGVLVELAGSFAACEADLFAGHFAEALPKLHTIKGLLAQIGGERIVRRLRSVEEQVHRGDSIAPPTLAELHTEFAALVAAVQEWR